MAEPNTPIPLVELAATIVSAFVAKNAVPRSDLPGLMQAVHASLAGLNATPAPVEVKVAREPAVPIKKSITPDYLISLEDGRRFKALRRHLRNLGLTPEQYRAKWNLPADHPMVAPNYAAARSALAKRAGLGQKNKGRGRSTKSEPASTP